MTQIETIIAEIKRRVNKYEDDHDPVPMALKSVIDFINSFPSELPSKELEYFATSLEETIGTSPHSRETIISYLQQAAQWQKEQLINKACEWLVNNVNGSIYYDDFDDVFVDTDELITAFKEAVEDKQ